MVTWLMSAFGDLSSSAVITTAVNKNRTHTCEGGKNRTTSFLFSAHLISNRPVRRCPRATEKSIRSVTAASLMRNALKHAAHTHTRRITCDLLTPMWRQSRDPVHVLHGHILTRIDVCDAHTDSSRRRYISHFPALCDGERMRLTSHVTSDVRVWETL